MATGPGIVGPYSSYIPNWESSGRLAIGFSRNPKKFAVAEYCQYVQSPHTQGYYLKVTAQEAARVVSANDNIWAFGANRPENPELETVNFLPFLVQRYDYSFGLDEDTVDQAEIPIAEIHAQVYAAKMMTARTNRVVTALTTTANWNTTADPDMLSSHYNTATTIAGGYIDKGTSVAPFFKILCDKVAVQIMQDTLSVVLPGDLMILMNPNQARLLAESPEVHDYLKGSPAALDEVRSGSSPNAAYGPGLPSTMYGYKIIVEPTIKLTARRGIAISSSNKTFVMPDQTIVFLARPGGLEGVFGMQSFSTMSLFWYRDEMTLEVFKDGKNRKYDHHIVEATTEIVTAPASGYLVTSTTSVAS